MKRQLTSSKVRAIAAGSRLGSKKEIAQRSLAKKTRKIKNNLLNSVAQGKINANAVGNDGLAFTTLNLKAIGNRQKRRILGRIIAAAARKR